MDRSPEGWTKDQRIGLKSDEVDWSPEERTKVRKEDPRFIKRAMVYGKRFRD